MRVPIFVIAAISALENSNAIGEKKAGHICVSKYTDNEDCLVDYGDLGTFSTAYPWSMVNQNFASFLASYSTFCGIHNANSTANLCERH